MGLDDVAKPSAVGWPLPDEQRATVLRLGELIRRCGAARFTQAHLVRADERDFPEPWDPTLAALYRLLYRLFWHAHLDADIVVDDVRGAPYPAHQLLTNTLIDFIEVENGRAHFQVAAFGNDDIAGLASHTIGAAFLQLAPGDPFRGAATHEVTETDASIAACYLGLGVLVANASMYRRYRSHLVGREVISEQRIEQTGGLPIADATLLLAVQLTVRDDVPGAVETLLAPQREWIERWLAVLEPHEAELRTMLELDDANDELPDRAREPREPPAVEERTPATRNEGRVSFRVPRRRHRLWAGLGVGLLVAIVFRIAWGENPILLVWLPIGAIAGYLVSRPGFACHACSATMTAELSECPTCRVTFEDTLATREQQAARRAEWAAQAEHDDPDLADEAERAYHPDV